MGTPQRSASTARSGRRAQSETLGFVLVFSIMLLGALVVVGLGATAISDTEEEISEERAEQALTQFDAKSALVALGEADSQRMQFADDDANDFNVRERQGWMNVTVENLTDGHEEEIMNVTLGALEYDGGSSKLAYQGGGVWRQTPNGGQMVSPPEFHFRNGTLTLPAINVSGSFDLGSTVDITQGAVNRTFPADGYANFTNPLDNHLVTVTVNSGYYRGWGSYFEERTDSEVEYFNGNETVRATLVSPVAKASVTTAASSLAAQGDFTVNGNAGHTCPGSANRFTDSYNSSNTNDGYCDQLDDGTTGNEGDIIYGGDIDVSSGSGSSDFCGDLIGGGSVTTAATGGNDGPTCGDGGGGQPTIYGHINYTDSCINCGDAIADHSSLDFAVHEIGGLDTIAPINWHVDNQVEEITDAASEHDPTDSTLGAGKYSFSTLSLASNEELTLNTSDGDIELAIHENIDLGKDAEINVTGNNNVYVYVDGSGIAGPHLEMADDSAISAPNDNATRFRLYGKDYFDASLGGGGAGSLARFTGIIYAPPGANGNGEVVINGAEILGGLLTGTTTIPSGGTGSIHYDEALMETNVLKPGSKVVKITYLHVTINEINVN